MLWMRRLRGREPRVVTSSNQAPPHGGNKLIISFGHEISLRPRDDHDDFCYSTLNSKVSEQSGFVMEDMCLL